MPRRPDSPVVRREILAFVLAGLLALAVIALSGWGGDESATPEGAPTPVELPTSRPAAQSLALC